MAEHIVPIINNNIRSTLPTQKGCRFRGLSFFLAAGVAVDSVVLMGENLVVSLPGGGTATLHTTGDFDPFDLSWRFDGAADAELAAYLDYALSQLALIEARIPADGAEWTAAQTLRARSDRALVEKALAALLAVGMQGLSVLTDQLAADAQHPLTDLRAQLVQQLEAALTSQTPCPHKD